MVSRYQKGFRDIAILSFLSHIHLISIEIKHRDQPLSTTLKNSKEKKTYFHPIDHNNTNGKIKKYNSRGDYFECRCQIHSWNPCSKQNLPQILLHIFAFSFSLLFCQLVEFYSVKTIFVFE